MRVLGFRAQTIGPKLSNGPKLLESSLDPHLHIPGAGFPSMLSSEEKRGRLVGCSVDLGSSASKLSETDSGRGAGNSTVSLLLPRNISSSSQDEIYGLQRDLCSDSTRLSAETETICIIHATPTAQQLEQRTAHSALPTQEARKKKPSADFLALVLPRIPKPKPRSPDLDIKQL